MRRSTVRSKKILVLGIGNTLLADEGVGVHAVQKLEEISLPENVELMDGGTGNFALLGPMQEADLVILIDATIDGAPAGTVHRLVPKFSSDYPLTITAHDIGLKDLLDAFYLTSKVPEVILFAVSIEPLAMGLSTDLSPEVNAAMPEIITRVQNEIKAQNFEA